MEKEAKLGGIVLHSCPPSLTNPSSLQHDEVKDTDGRGGSAGLREQTARLILKKKED